MRVSRRWLSGVIAAAAVAAIVLVAVVREHAAGPGSGRPVAAPAEPLSDTRASDPAAAGPPEPGSAPPAAGATLLDSVADPFGAAAQRPLRYAQEYPTIDYTGGPLTGRLGAFTDGLATGSVTLDDDSPQGYLDSLLDALDIDVSSQIMVFSKTSLNVDTILPESPRAIYFNDDTYVAYLQGAAVLEIASMDPVLGPVFHTLGRGSGGEPELRREDSRCLRCHDSLTMTGGGVPRLLLGSGYIGKQGELVSHEAWILMRPWTPLRNRWGGWYVTGTHGEQVHLGNIVVEDIADLQDVDSLRIGNRDNLDGLLDTNPYPAPYSDIVALLVVQRQIQTQNDITRSLWDLLTAIDARVADAEAVLAAMPAEELEPLLYEHTEVLIESLVNAFGVELTDPVTGTSGFTEWFEAQGPRDAEGRSLRDLDLKTRVFRYPLSYEIYSDAFAALPVQARRYIYRRIREELTLTGRLELDNVPEADRLAALEILAATLPDYAAAAD